MAEIVIIDAGRMRYGEALALQKTLVEGKKAGDLRDYLLFVEHEPVVTLGRNADERHLVAPRKSLAAKGIDVYDVERGGDVTYHGPGQLVGYPVIDLKARNLRLQQYMRSLENVLIGALARFGISGYAREGLTGVWTAQGKIAAIGVAVTRWVTFHGFALNVEIDPADFDCIVPCGLAGERVTSMRALLGNGISSGEVRRALSDLIQRL